MKLIPTDIKNNVLGCMIRILDENREEILEANKKDLELFKGEDQALYDRLVINDAKINGMIEAITEVKAQADPVNREISSKKLDNGLEVINKTAPFGTILIIYESRPDVTIEAAVLAFKANNKILLKGGKEAFHSNKVLVDLWHRALRENGLSTDFIEMLTLNREQTQEFLIHKSSELDLIVPRGGERLIAFVKQNAQCPVLVSGRGNNFLYVDEDASWQKSVEVILNAKTHKISACNALDKILINPNIEDYQDKVKELSNLLEDRGVEVLVDTEVKTFLTHQDIIKDKSVWDEEFLAMKCCIGEVNSVKDAIQKINDHSGGHSATIMTENSDSADLFMEQVDCAAVYKNASTRFTDGGQMGVGAELAISTDKLHHRGPLGLDQLVSNKYYVYGDGQVRV
ncbi:MAG: glutamate-5-semialdehyde dehydrogenase [Aquimarina sp.]|nr:glutamate-5-semialdehyde dehydrogenase [Aquimarina sp.]